MEQVQNLYLSPVTLIQQLSKVQNLSVRFLGPGLCLGPGTGTDLFLSYDLKNCARVCPSGGLKFRSVLFYIRFGLPIGSNR